MDDKWSKVPLLMPAVAMALGTGLADGHTVGWPLWALMAATLTVALATSRWAAVQSVAIVVAFGVFGAVLCDLRQARFSTTADDGWQKHDVVVVSQPIEKTKTVELDALIAGQDAKLKCHVAKDGRSRMIGIGDRLTISVKTRHWSQYDGSTTGYGRFLMHHGFVGSCYVAAGRWSNRGMSGEGLSPMQKTRLRFLLLRERLLLRYRQMGIAGDSYAVLSAMTLGSKSAMTAQLRQTYSATGASHVLALSGLHLSIVYMMFSLLTVGRRRGPAIQAVTIAAIWAFALLTGLSASVVRSATMLTVYGLFSLAGRQRASLNVLSFTAMLMLTVDSFALFDVGFQMSFMAVGSIVLFAPLLTRLMPEPVMQRHAVARWAWGLATVSVAAQIGVAPLIAYYFHSFSTCFLPANFIAIPIATLTLYAVPLMLAVPQVAPVVAWLTGALNRALAWMASLPAASIDDLWPTKTQTTLAYVLAGCLWIVLRKLVPSRR